MDTQEKAEASTQAAAVELPLLFRLALRLVLREMKKHPHTLLQLTLTALEDDKAPIPGGWLYRQAVSLVRSEARLRPHTLMAHALAELRAAAAAGGLAELPAAEPEKT